MMMCHYSCQQRAISEDILGSSAVLYILVVLSMGNLPSFTGLSVYNDKQSCTAAIATMTPALAPDEKSVKLACVSSTDLEVLAKSAGF